SAGHEIAQAGSFYPGGLATRHWLQGYYIQERLTLEIPPATAPGDYTLEAALYDPQTQRSLDVINAQGNPEDVKTRLGLLSITRPTQGEPAEIEQPLTMSVGEGLVFVGYAPLPAEAQVGQEITLTAYWQAEAVPQIPLMFRLVWLDAEDKLAAATPD